MQLCVGPETLQLCLGLHCGNASRCCWVPYCHLQTPAGVWPRTLCASSLFWFLRRQSSSSGVYTQGFCSQTLISRNKLRGVSSRSCFSMKPRFITDQCGVTGGASTGYGKYLASDQRQELTMFSRADHHRGGWKVNQLQPTARSAISISEVILTDRRAGPALFSERGNGI